MSKPIILIIRKRWRQVSVVSEKSIIFAANMTKDLYIISGCNVKLEEGLQIAEKRMLEEKALRGEDLIVSSDGKTIERIPARQYLPQ